MRNAGLAPPYVIDTLGPRPNMNAESWDRAAMAVERYRHCSLGVEPSAGHIDTPGRSAAIGKRPAVPLLFAEWDNTMRSIRDSKPILAEAMHHVQA